MMGCVKIKCDSDSSGSRTFVVTKGPGSICHWHGQNLGHERVCQVRRVNLPQDSCLLEWICGFLMAFYLWVCIGSIMVKQGKFPY